jgi:hypothetical protein
MSEKLVTVARFPDSAQASLAKQLLADFGIESVLAGQHASNVYSGVPAIADVELQTLESQAEEARQILESHEKQEQ